MARLILPPPICDIYDIVHDMIPTVAPDADGHAIKLSVILVQQLFSLCEQAKGNPTAEKIFISMFRSLLEIDPARVDIDLDH